MRCKACGDTVTKRKAKILDPDSDQVELDFEEDLCNTCLGVAFDAYLGYNDDIEVRNASIRREFYSSDHSESYLGEDILYIEED